VVGGGPAGLEAARVSAARGHEVVLFEKAAALGGQINIAAKAGWREALSGIPRWLAAQVRELGVDVRLNTEASPEAVLAERPDIVIIAAGGAPNAGFELGADLVLTTAEVLRSGTTLSGSVLLYDGMGQHNASSCAEFLATRGALVEMITPDRMAAEEVGTTNQPVHLREMTKLGVIMTPNLDLLEVKRENNRLVAVLKNTMTLTEEERIADHIVVDFGTLPVDDTYFALKAQSTNRGQADIPSLIGGLRQPHVGRGGFPLYRIGDAAAGRNIHAAIYDALRLCKDF